MRRGYRIFAAACVISLLVHFGLMATEGRWWALPQEDVASPLQARLVDAPAPPAQAGPAPPPPPPQAPSAPPPVSPPVASLRPAAASVPASPLASSPAPEGASDVVSGGPPPQPVVPQPAAEPSSPKPAPPAPPVAVSPQAAAEPQRRTLPEKMVLIYNVHFGADGFKLGQATYTWQARGERYSLESVAEAKGVAALFVSGRIVQTSEGRIDANGLLPAHFQMTKNERRKNIADFDWRLRQLNLPKGREPMREGTQDQLSFPFHLALSVMADDADWVLPVTDGRKLKDYRFSVKGRERLAIGGRQTEALHVQGNRAGEDGLDVWLAPERHWLPVRIRTRDDKGQVVELTLAELSD